MITLAIECSTALASVGLFDGAKPLALQESPDPRKHSEFIHPALQKCLQDSGLTWSQVDRIAVGKGPGSFTGIRVGVNVARALAATLQKPICATHSLELLRGDFHRRNPTQPVLTLLNAYRNLVFGAFFQDASSKPEPACWSMKELTQIVTSHRATTPLLCVGEGWNCIQPLLAPEILALMRRSSEWSDFPTAQELASWTEQNSGTSTLDWKTTIPLYIRASAAEENSGPR